MADKLPAMPWYPGDWFKDRAVAMCRIETRGVWTDLLLSMWTDDRCGRVVGTIAQLASLARCTPDEMGRAIDDLADTKTADVTFCNGKVSVTNRRMRREYEKRKSAAKRQRKARGVEVDSESTPDSHANVTTPLSVSSSISVSTTVEKPPLPPGGEPPPAKGRKRKSDSLAMALPALSEFPESIRTEPCRMAWQAWLAYKLARKAPYRMADGQAKELAAAAAKGPEAFLGALALARRREWQGVNLRLYLEFLAEGKINADGSDNLEVSTSGNRPGRQREIGRAEQFAEGATPSARVGW